MMSSAVAANKNREINGAGWLFFAENFEGLLAEDAVAGDPAG
jgi:hypothetical protein